MRFLVAFILLLMAIPACAADVTYRCVAKPLRLVAEDIMAQTRSDVVIEKRLAEKKLVIAVKNVPEDELWPQMPVFWAVIVFVQRQTNR